VIGETAARGGRVVVPAFAVGRTQELVHRLDQLVNEGRLPPIPVFVDSPLAVNVTEVFRRHPECFDRELLA
jgi:metallo-beta-lactamase family protein